MMGTGAKSKEAACYYGSVLIRAADGISRDILTTILEPDKLYTPDEAAGLLEEFLKKEANPDGRRNMDHTK